MTTLPTTTPAIDTSIAAFAAWLARRNPDAIVGCAHSNDGCPLQTYWTDTITPPLPPTALLLVTHHEVRCVQSAKRYDQYWALPLPDWAVDFTQRIDKHHHTTMQPITARGARRTLRNVLKELLNHVYPT